jgi:hypothetical protein
MTIQTSEAGLQTFGQTVSASNDRGGPCRRRMQKIAKGIVVKMAIELVTVVEFLRNVIDEARACGGAIRWDAGPPHGGRTDRFAAPANDLQ